MFLDSGKIISDETFCTQSNNGGKSSRILGIISMPSSGDGKRNKTKVLCASMIHMNVQCISGSCLGFGISEFSDTELLTNTSHIYMPVSLATSLGHKAIIAKL